MDSVILGSGFQVYIPLKLFNIAINSAVEDLDANLVCNFFKLKGFTTIIMGSNLFLKHMYATIKFQCIPDSSSNQCVMITLSEI